MLFIHPMWSCESERIGKQKCTPLGYALHVVADWLGLAGLMLLLVVAAVLVWRWAISAFNLIDLWLLALPFAVGIVSEAVFLFSWWLAWKKGFEFNYNRRESSWLEGGERRTYRSPDLLP